MNILVTGGAGFQGSHVTEMLLAKGHHVRVLNTPSELAHANMRQVSQHPNLEVVWGSITDREVVAKAARGCEALFHFAAQISVDVSLEHPERTAEVNVLGTMNVLAAARAQRARLVHASTCEVYGTAQTVPMAETHPLNPSTPYAATKAAADRIVYAFSQCYGLDATIVRPFNIYGPRQKSKEGGAVVPIFIRMVREGRPPRIFGTGEQTRDYLYVDDLVEAYRIVLETTGLRGRVLNFGSGQETSVKTVAETVLRSLGSPLAPEHAPQRAGEVMRFVADIRKARDLGFTPRVSFQEGVARTCKWFTSTDLAPPSGTGYPH